MSLEGVYGFALRAYPRSWRAERRDEVLGVLMDSAADRQAVRPRAVEVANLIVHGMAARVATLTRPVGDGVRAVVARTALCSLTVLSLLLVAFGEVWPWKGAGAVQAPSSWFDGTVGPFFTVGGPSLTLLLVACSCAYLGRTRIVTAVVPACAAVLVVSAVAASFLGLNRPAVWAVFGVTVLAGLTRVGDLRMSPRWVVGTAAVALASSGAMWGRLAFASDPRPFFYYQRLGDALPAWALTLLAAGIVVAAARRVLLGVLPVTAVWLVILSLQQQSSFQPRGALLAGGLALLAAVTSLVALLIGRASSPPRPIPAA